MTQEQFVTITFGGKVIKSTKSTRATSGAPVSGNKPSRATPSRVTPSDNPSETTSSTTSGTTGTASSTASGMASGTRRKATRKEETPARAGQPWTPLDNEVLLQMKAEGRSHRQVGAVLQRSAQSCRLALMHIRSAQAAANAGKKPIGVTKITGVKKTSDVTERAIAKKPTNGKEPADDEKTSGDEGASPKPAIIISPPESPEEKKNATVGGSIPSAPQLPPTSNIGGWRPSTAEAASRLLDVMEGSSSNAAGASSSASVGLPAPFSEGAHNLMVLATAAQHHRAFYASEAPPPADQSTWAENDWRSRRMLATMIDSELVRLRRGCKPTEESLAEEGGLLVNIMNDLHGERTVRRRGISRWNPRGSSARS